MLIIRCSKGIIKLKKNRKNRKNRKNSGNISHKSLISIYLNKKIYKQHHISFLTLWNVSKDLILNRHKHKIYIKISNCHFPLLVKLSDCIETKFKLNFFFIINTFATLFVFLLLINITSKSLVEVLFNHFFFIFFFSFSKRLTFSCWIFPLNFCWFQTKD